MKIRIGDIRTTCTGLILAAVGGWHTAQAATHDLGDFTVTLHPFQLSGSGTWYSPTFSLESFEVAIGDRIIGSLRFTDGQLLRVSDSTPIGRPLPFSTRSAGVILGGIVDGMTYQSSSFSTFNFFNAGGDLQSNPTASGGGTTTTLNYQGVSGSVWFGQPAGTSLLAGWDFDIEVTSLPLDSFALDDVRFNILGAVAIVPEPSLVALVGLGAATFGVARRRWK
jgi:hypothetical protein